jgi:hypothetical protein
MVQLLELTGEIHEDHFAELELPDVDCSDRVMLDPGYGREVQFFD